MLLVELYHRNYGDKVERIVLELQWQPLHIKLDPNSVAASVVRAAIIMSDVVAAALTALQKGN